MSWACHTRRFLSLFTILSLPGLPSPAWAGDATSPLAQARAMMAGFENKVFRSPIKAHWLPDGQRLWYRVETGPDAREYILVDARKGTRGPAFNHARLAQSLEKSVGKPISPTRLDLEKLEFPDDQTLRFLFEGAAWTCRLETYELERSKNQAPAEDVEDVASDRSRSGGEETTLVFENQTTGPVNLFWIDPEGERHPYGKIEAGESRSQHTFAGHVWLIVDAAGAPLRRVEGDAEPKRVRVTGPRNLPEPRPRRSGEGRRQASGGDPANSPDGKWHAFIRDYNLWVASRPESGTQAQEFALSTDGSAENSYGGPFVWSPDSSNLLAVQTEPAQEHKVTIVESSPNDQVQPKLRVLDYLKPGDKIAPGPACSTWPRSGISPSMMHCSQTPGASRNFTGLPIPKPSSSSTTSAGIRSCGCSA